MAVAEACVSFMASATFLKTGSPRCSVPAFLGFVPPTTFVPAVLSVLPPHSIVSAVSLGAYRIQSLVVRGSCSCISTSCNYRRLRLHSRSLLSSEALEEDPGVAVDAKVLNRLGVL
jgi:hypothetical protein